MQNILPYLIVILPITVQSQEFWDNSGSFYPGTDMPVYQEADYPIDYYYNRPYYTRGLDRDRQGFPNIYSGVRYDNSDYFTTGISSYQGTSTGPGPNGGYPGTPRGSYQTNYIDRTIYPNSYMQVNTR